ncbi:hypothetical protein F4775DRAFT_600352 [Biscogniauxia sp. FL1348]|nr:hypothetical protein F4775DRAFT_600352 [Biscogniauxia sp. FL1348]
MTQTTAAIRDLREWTCGHITSLADADFINYGVPGPARNRVARAHRRCPDCRQDPFYLQLQDLEAMTVRYAAEVTESMRRFRRDLTRLTTRHRGWTRDYASELERARGAGGSRTFSRDLVEPDAGPAMALNWLAVEGTMVAGRRAEIDDAARAVAGFRARLAFLQDVADLMAGIARKPAEWAAEDGNEHFPRVRSLQDRVLDFAVHVRAWVVARLADRRADLDGFDASIGYLRDMWRVQQDVGKELLPGPVGANN